MFKANDNNCTTFEVVQVHGSWPVGTLRYGKLVLGVTS